MAARISRSISEALLIIVFSLASTQAVGAEATAPEQVAESGWRATVCDFAARHFRHPAWGYSHSVRIYALARELRAADNVTIDDDVLFADNRRRESDNLGNL